MANQAIVDVARALEASRLAAAVNTSPLVLGFLSGVHLLGYTLTIGAALLSNLRVVGVLLAERPVLEVARPATRALLVGCGLSLVTGFLLLAPRAAGAIQNEFFILKMTLLGGAVIVQGVTQRAVLRSDRLVWQPWAAGVSLALWIGVLLAACAFILIE